MTRPARLWINLTYGLWFLPSMIVVLLIGLAIGITELDRRIDVTVLRKWAALMSADAGSAREILSAISSSMVTVAGVVFSITIVTLALAASQYSSRVLRTFTRDKVNQVVLGGMAGTFAYCLTVLLTFTNGEGAFVPSIAVFTGVMLAVGGVFALIFFIHHVADGIQAAAIIAAVAADTVAAVTETFTGTGARRSPGEDAGAWVTAPASRTGYIEWVDVGALASFAKQRGAVVRMDRSAGDFVVERTPLISVRMECAPDPAAVAALNRAHAVGRFRTVEQDPDFGIRQLADIAMRALSPGVNDTTTAVLCVDHLTAILLSAAELREAENVHSPEGALLVIVRGPSFEALVDRAFDQIRQNAAGNIAVITALLNGLEKLAPAVNGGPRRAALTRQLRAIEELVARTVESPTDRREVQDHIAAVSRRGGW